MTLPVPAASLEYERLSPLIDEDDDPKDRNSFKEIEAKWKTAKVPRGIARMSLAVMADEFDAAFQRGEDVANRRPKKIINFINHRMLVLAATTQDPKLFMECLNFIHDRFDGRAAQSVALTDPQGGALTVQVLKLTQNANANPAE